MAEPTFNLDSPKYETCYPSRGISIGAAIGAAFWIVGFATYLAWKCGAFA